MPFKSEAQRRLFWAKVHRGEIERGVAEEWEAATPKGKKLPEHVKSAEVAAVFEKMAMSPFYSAFADEITKISVDPALMIFAGELEKIAAETGMDKEAILGALAKGGRLGLKLLQRGAKAIGRQGKLMRATMKNRAIAKQTMAASKRLSGPMGGIVQRAQSAGVPLQDLGLGITPGVSKQVGRMAGKAKATPIRAGGAGGRGGAATRQAGPATQSAPAGGGTAAVNPANLPPPPAAARAGAGAGVNAPTAVLKGSATPTAAQATAAPMKPTNWSMGTKELAAIPGHVPQSAVMADPLRFGAMKVSMILKMAAALRRMEY